MRLESALYSSRSGIDSHGQAIAVIGDNIANVSTVGFKTSRPEFSDIFAEGGFGRQSAAGAVTGNGVKIEQVTQIHENGVVEPTERELDASIEGKGFFMVGAVDTPEYTRAGNFSINETGLLVNTDGKPVLGFVGDTTTLGELNVLSIQVKGKATTTSSLFGNLSSTAPVTTPPANPATFKELNKFASFTSNYSVYDTLGAEHNVTVAFFKTAANTWTAQAYTDGKDVGGTENQPVKISGDATLNFTSTGTIDPAQKTAATLTLAPAFAGGAAPGNFPLDLSGFSQFSAPNQLNSVIQDGESAGQIKNYEIKNTGQLLAVLDNGNRAQIGTLALANFANINGLQRSGSSTFRESLTTGSKTVAKPGIGVNGKVTGNSLERSTVDISGQFVELILYQRGYEANSQSLNTTNELIKNTIQLLR